MEIGDLIQESNQLKDLVEEMEVEKHVEELCDALIERDYGLNIWAYARVDTIKDGMLPKLKAAGLQPQLVGARPWQP